MIQAVIKTDECKTTDAFISLKAYFPHYGAMCFLNAQEHEEFKRSIDRRESYRDALEHQLTHNLMQEEINDILELRSILFYFLKDKNDDNSKINDAIDLCKKLEKNLKIKAIYEDESQKNDTFKEFTKKFNENEIKKFLDENKG